MDCCSSAESGQGKRPLEAGLSFGDLAVVRWYMPYRQLSAILVTISFACSSVAWYPICTLKFNGVSRPFRRRRAAKQAANRGVRSIQDEWRKRNAILVRANRRSVSCGVRRPDEESVR